MLLMFNDMKLAETGLQPGWVVILDTKGASFGHLAKLNLTMVKLFVTYIQECQPIVLKAIHFVNVVPVLDKVLLLAKPFLKSELMKMFHFHPSLKELSNHIPLSILPKEYGGELESAATIHDKQRLLMKEYSSWYKQEETLKVDESKRTGNKHPYFEEFQGTEGSFRKLEID
ncbi:hypothetical protein C0J52_14956 [Blattella germanica]|nr:hypothetical protein C0J52_14956 [Blattella germanica]